jgi:catechol 2,3-dioxygenase-like lactoylglutathione lyase family enzyme
MEVNGIAHIQLTVTNVKESTKFYEPFLHFLEMKTLIQTDEFFYCIGSRTGIAICQVDPELEGGRFVQRRVGLHHLCLRAREREDVDEICDFVKSLGVTIVHPPREDAFAPGYYSVLLEDRDGIRIEVNHVPGKGHLAKKDPA